MPDGFSGSLRDAQEELRTSEAHLHETETLFATAEGLRDLAQGKYNTAKQRVAELLSGNR